MVDQTVLDGKMLFLSFHQSKGLERKICINFQFDAGYFKFYNTEHATTTICPNIYYVALTRASELLILIHHYENDYFEFIHKKNLEYYCNVEKIVPFRIKSDPLKLNTKNFIVTEFLKCKSPELLKECCDKFLNVTKLRDVGDKINIDGITKQQNGLYESVSDLTGIAIPLYLEFISTGKIEIFQKNGGRKK